MRLLICFILALSVLIPSAFAGDDQHVTTISLVPIVNEALEYIVVIVIAIIGWGVSRVTGYLRKWLGIRVDDSQRAVVMGAVERGVNYATDAVREMIANSDYLTVDCRTLLITTAIRYVQKRIPDALRHFKLTPDDVGDMVAAKLEELGTVDKLNISTAG